MSETRYLEDFQIGERWVSGPVALSAEEIIVFGRANDPQPMHTDPAYGAAGPFGSVIASGWQVAILAMRVFIDAGGYGDTPMLGMGIDELRWLKPVRPGDQLTVERDGRGQALRVAARPRHGAHARRRAERSGRAGALAVLARAHSRAPRP